MKTWIQQVPTSHILHLFRSYINLFWAHLTLSLLHRDHHDPPALPVSAFPPPTSSALCVWAGGDLRTPRAVSTQQKWALRRGRCCSCRGTSGWSHCSRDPSGTGEQRFGAEPGWAALLHTHEWMYEPTHSHIQQGWSTVTPNTGKHIAAQKLLTCQLRRNISR